MTAALWCHRAQSELAPHLANNGQVWDLLVIGGGITGAGILLEAAKRGLKAVLVEQRDFAWGTSGRSSKLVHGGLRYLKEGKLHLTRDSVHERQRLMQEVGGLVDEQSFAFADYKGRKPGRWMFALGLAIYDRMAKQRARHYFPADEFLMLAPHVSRRELQGGLCYTDAKTDDARLVMRVLQEAQAAGATAVNYLAVDKILYTDGRASGVQVRDAVGGASFTIAARVVVNATGAWADRLRQRDANAAKIRPLRGSHLIFPLWRVPVAQAVSLMHPRDGRPVFLFPWEGVCLAGTTDVDHRADLQNEAAITGAEVSYLMEALAFQFPALNLQLGDIMATYAGVRPVIDSGKADPSKEGRDHAVWLENGLLTVTGGKLTTYRLIALDALKHIAALLPDVEMNLAAGAAPDTPRSATLERSGLAYAQRRRLTGHYGRAAPVLAGIAREGELELIPGSETLWVELRWAARCEAVVHLEDLLLRRTRLGLLLRAGGVAELPRIRAICQPELGWDDAQWEREEAAYLALWKTHYSLPPPEQIPTWPQHQ